MSQRCIQRRQDRVETVSTSDGRKAVRPQRVQAHLTKPKHKLETCGLNTAVAKSCKGNYALKAEGTLVCVSLLRSTQTPWPVRSTPLQVKKILHFDAYVFRFLLHSSTWSFKGHYMRMMPSTACRNTLTLMWVRPASCRAGIFRLRLMPFVVTPTLRTPFNELSARTISGRSFRTSGCRTKQAGVGI